MFENEISLHMPRAKLSSEINGLPLATLAPTVAWLHQHGVKSGRLAFLFGTDANHIRQLVYRGKSEAGIRIPLSGIDPLAEPQASIRTILGVRPYEDSVVLDGAEKARLEILESEIEQAAAGFWNGVRFERSVPQFNLFIPRIGYAAHYRRIRLLARLRQLIAETLLHSGRTASSIEAGNKALLLSRIAYGESDDPWDLGQVARTARLISQAYIIRKEVDQVRRYLEIHRAASEQAGLALRPEYFHQYGAIAVQMGQGAGTKKLFTEAMNRLAETVDYGQVKAPHEVRDIGCRHINYLEGNWDASQELLDDVIRSYPAGDIHVPINVCWTAATGFSSDSDDVHNQADNLLRQHPGVADGYGRQATCYRLLTMTTELPKPIRRDFALLALYQNAFRNH